MDEFLEQWWTPQILLKKDGYGFSWKLTIWNDNGDFKIITDSSFGAKAIAAYINQHYECDGFGLDDGRWIFRRTQ